jgi:hypothetical protein
MAETDLSKSNRQTAQRHLTAYSHIAAWSCTRSPCVAYPSAAADDRRLGQIDKSNRFPKIERIEPLSLSLSLSLARGFADKLKLPEGFKILVSSRLRYSYAVKTNK